MTHLVRRPQLSRLWHHGPAALAVLGVCLLFLRAPDQPSTADTVLAVAVLQLVLVLAWSVALGFRGSVGAGLIGAGAAVAANLVVLRAADSAEQDAVGPSSPFATGGGLGDLAAVLALAVVLSFVHQLIRRPPRRQVTDSLAGVALLAVAVVGLSTYLVLVQLPDGAQLLRICVASVGAAVITGHVVDLLVPYPRIVEGVPRGVLGFVAGVVAAILAATYLGEADRLVEQLGAVILGGVLGGVACLVAIGASYAAVERRGIMVAQAAVQAVLPFALAAPVAYFVSILVGG